MNPQFRKKKDLFDGTIKLTPKPTSIDEILYQVKYLGNLVLTKALHMKPKISYKKRGDNWNKKSIFFQHPY